MSGPKFVGNLVALELAAAALFDLAAAEVDERTTVQDLRPDSGIKSVRLYFRYVCATSEDANITDSGFPASV